MKKTALLHLHPDFLIFSESILLAKRCFKINRFDCHHGPTLQKAYPLRFWRYLRVNSIAISKSFGVELVFGVWSFRLSLSTLYGFWKYFVSNSLYCKSRRIAIRDSITRGKFSYCYLVLPVWLRRIVEAAMIPWFDILRISYRNILSRNSYSLVIVSHGCYVPYVALIESALDIGIDVMVVDGSRAYCIKQRQETYHGHYYQSRIFKSYEKIARVAEKCQFNGLGSDSLFRGMDLQKYGKDKISNRVLAVFPHCIKDVNNISPSHHLVFRSYFDWLCYTVWILCSQKCYYDAIVFKIHPHASRYQDEWMLRLMSNMLKYGINRKKIVAPERIDEDFWRNVVSGKTIISPVSVNGSIVNEAALCGFKSITPGIAQAFPSAYTHTRNTEEYKQRILAPQEDKTDKDIIISDAKKYREILAWFTLKKTTSLKELQACFFFEDMSEIDANSLSKVCQEWEAVTRLTRVDIDDRVQFLINSQA